MMKREIDFCRVRSTELDKNRQLEIMPSEAIQHFKVIVTEKSAGLNMSNPQ